MNLEGNTGTVSQTLNGLAPVAGGWQFFILCAALTLKLYTQLRQ